MSEFVFLTVEGDSFSRGLAHGEAFRQAISESYEFYVSKLFADQQMSISELESYALTIRSITQEYAPDCADEIEGISVGAQLEPWKVFLLNGRTEILNSKVGECTTLYFKDHAILAQNWDWLENLEALSVIIHHRRSNRPDYITFSEVGMIGKIGMNQAGLGVGLNILFCPHELSGLPTHITCRDVLDATSLEAARQRLLDSEMGKASHILIGDSSGSCASFEFVGQTRHEVVIEQEAFLHTNHCIAADASNSVVGLANSRERFSWASELIHSEEKHNLAAAKKILLSRVPGPSAINRPYVESEAWEGYRVGTCATILMELKPRIFHVKRGPGALSGFVSYGL